MKKATQAHDASASAAPEARERITVTSAQVAAAKLQITLDKMLGRKTPKIIKLIAAAK